MSKLPSVILNLKILKIDIITPMEYFKPSKEEKQLLKEIKAGEWKSVSNLVEVKKDLIKASKNTIRLFKLGKHPSQL